MTTSKVRSRFSLLLKELHNRHGNNQSLLDFYDSLQNFRQESISKISNDKQAIKDTMILELLSMDPDISLEWLFTGEGTMFKSDNPINKIAHGLKPFEDRVEHLERRFTNMESLLKETLELTQRDLKNRGLLDKN